MLQFSFMVCYLKVYVGVVIMVSYNLLYDNGFKVYFEDGGQVVLLYDKGIVVEVNVVLFVEFGVYLDKSFVGVMMLIKVVDDVYLLVVVKVVIDGSVFKKMKFKVVFINIYGMGGIVLVFLLLYVGVEVYEVQVQVVFDLCFLIVKLLNLENVEVFFLVVKLVEDKGLDVVMVIDLDCDCVGCVVCNCEGKIEFFIGNQIGVFLVVYCIGKYKELGWILQDGGFLIVFVKMFVILFLQDVIGCGYGVKVVNMLIGFKWIVVKICGYEEQLKGKLFVSEGIVFDYDVMLFEMCVKFFQKYSLFYFFGGEESYGYFGNDYVCDKDGNVVCVMFVEFCVYVKSCGLMVIEYFDEIYLKYGFFFEGVINFYYEGVSGVVKIKCIFDIYCFVLLVKFGDVVVVKFQDFGCEMVIDVDGEMIFLQDLYFVILVNGYSFVVCGSGMELKMKFYLFVQGKVGNVVEFVVIKVLVKVELECVKVVVEVDVKQCVEG